MLSINNWLLILQIWGTALIAASKGGHTETVKCLIDANAKIDLQHEASTHHLTICSPINTAMYYNCKGSYLL